jgi:hypothetical protein
MPTFGIRYGEFEYDRSPGMRYHYFDVRCGGAEERIAVGVEDQVWILWGLGGRANGQEIERRVTLRYLKEHLANTTTLASHRVLLTAWDEPASGEGLTVHRLPEESPYEWKECRFRKRRAAGPVCIAAGPADRVLWRTTQALCEHCGLPSTDILCDNLVNIETVGMETDQTGLLKRSLIDPQCNIGSEKFGKPDRDAKLCVPGGRSCWVQTYKPPEPAAAVETSERNLPAEVLDMVDTLNVIFRDQFDAELFRLKQFRTGRVLMEPCATEEGFAHKLQVLGDLIDLINSKELGEAQGVTSERGSVNWLAAFLGKVAQSDAAAVVQTLRDIRAVRNQVAAHSAAAGDFVDACARLRIDLPITDWEAAWAQVLSAFLDALRSLQGLLP